MVIMRTVRGSYGDILVVVDSSLATYTAQGYAEIAAPYIAIASHNPAWDVGPTYRIAHADGRQYATTYANYQQYYAPLGFTLGVPEIATVVPPIATVVVPIATVVPPIVGTRTTIAGDIRTTLAGDTRITGG